MNDFNYYHMFANGDDAKNFLTSEDDYYAAFNRFGVCAANNDCKILCFSLEDTHPHGLLYGTLNSCLSLLHQYEQLTLSYIRLSRGTTKDVVFECELLEIKDRDHLMNVGTYIINQPTKDGKKIMPYDYLWGTGSMYFRPEKTIVPWRINNDGSISDPVTIGKLPVRQRLKILHSKQTVPDDWIVCNGFILPSNYISVKAFEQIYSTHNCFRAFLSSGGKRDEIIKNSMAASRGVIFEDLEARNLRATICADMYGTNDPRKLDGPRRINLAIQLRKEHRLNVRQIASLVYLPEEEIRKYVI